MKKAFTLIEAMVATVIGLTLCAIIYSIFHISAGGLNGNYTAEELLWPEQTKARYQREMVEELRRANDLKERE